jgi:ABC-type transporter Mla subunit MlaD
MSASYHHSREQFKELASLERPVHSLINQNRRLFGAQETDSPAVPALTQSIPTVEGKLNRVRQKIDSTLASNAGAMGVMWPADIYLGHDD